MSYQPLNYNISEIRQNLDNIEFTVQFSNDICYPNISLGYNHFTLQNSMKYKDEVKKYYKVSNSNEDNEFIKMITEEFSVNQIEKKDSYDNSCISDAFNNYIHEIDSNIPVIRNRYVMQMWEMIIYFDLIKKKSSTLHISDKINYFSKSYLLYKLVNYGKLENVSIHYKHEAFDDDFLKYFKKNINPMTQDLYDFITIEDYMTNDVIELSESRYIKTFFDNIILGLKHQNNDGSMVIKIYDNYSQTTIHLLELLKCFYETVHICKPLTSLKTSPEKYVICKNFKGIHKKMMKTLETMNADIIKNNEYHISKILKIEISDDMLSIYRKYNIIQGMQYHYYGIIKFFDYITLDNKAGDEFYKLVQIFVKANVYWINAFLNKENYPNLKLI